MVYAQVYKDKMDLLDKVPSFQIMHPQQMDKLVDAMELVTFPAGHNIITQVRLLSRSSQLTINPPSSVYVHAMQAIA